MDLLLDKVYRSYEQRKSGGDPIDFLCSYVVRELPEVVEAAQIKARLTSTSTTPLENHENETPVDATPTPDCGIPIPGVRPASPWQGYGSPSKLSASPVLLRSKVRSSREDHILLRAAKSDRPRFEKDDQEEEKAELQPQEESPRRAVAVASAPSDRNVTVFLGTFFLITGFSARATSNLAEIIKYHGGTVLDSIKDLAGSRTDCSVFIVAKDQTRTIKLLLGIVAGLPIVKPAWIQASIESGELAPTCKRSLVFRDRQPKLFASPSTFILFGSPSFVGSDFKIVLEAGGALCIPYAAGAGERKRKRKGEGIARDPITLVLCESPDVVDQAESVFDDMSTPLCDYKLFCKAIAQGSIGSLLKGNGNVVCGCGAS